MVRKKMFWLIKIPLKVLIKSRFRASSLSTYDFSILYTFLPHNLIMKKPINLNETTFH